MQQWNTSMKRRTLMRKIGATGIGAAAISGPAAAAERPSVSDLGIDRDIDVASMEGRVPLGELLEPHELASLPAGVDASRRITVAAEADVVTLGECCPYCCWPAIMPCDCDCCDCDMLAC